MTPMTEIADTFFKKLEAGQGWDARRTARPTPRSLRRLNPLPICNTYRSMQIG